MCLANIDTSLITEEIRKAAEVADAKDLARGSIDAARLLDQNCNALKTRLLMNAAKLNQFDEVVTLLAHYKARTQNMEAKFGGINPKSN